MLLPIKMHSLLLLFSCVLVAYPGTILGQSIIADSAVKIKPYRNSVYAELAGNGIIGSLNYERLVPNKRGNQAFAFRFGGIITPVINIHKDNPNFYVSEVSFFRGKGALKYELGVGITLHHDWDYVETYRIGRLGLRWAPVKIPVLIRFAFIPIHLDSDYKRRIVPWGGLSIGYSFGR